VSAVAQPTLTRVVSTLRASARRKADAPDGDRDLLTRFVKHRDEAAFRSLVHRHGPTVLTACRQVLSDPADIDDAFQATFLVLLKKVQSIDAAVPLGGWLFTAAHRVAVRCRADNTRRRAREAEAARRQPVTTELPDVSWREAAAVLHAELNALPEKYRLPLLLCGVRGLTRDEAAEQLGTTVGAVRGQLERGRALLERRLTKRGIVLSAGLLAVLLMGSSRAAGGPSAELIDRAVRALGGHTSAAVAALANGAFPMTPLKQMILPVVLMFGLIGAGLGSPPPIAAPGEKSAPKMEKPKADARPEPTRPEPKKPEAKERTITGKVLDADGKPVEAELSLVWLEGNPQPLGKTKADGTFSASVPLKFKDQGGWLVARAAGHGFDFRPTGIEDVPQSMTASADLTLTLPRGRSIKGRVLDLQGKPVAGATVMAIRFAAYDNDVSMNRHLNAWAAEHNRGGLPPYGDRTMYFTDKYEVKERPYTATSNKDGHFEITGTGANQLVILQVRGPGVADKEFVTLNRDGFDPVPFNNSAEEHGKKAYSFVRKWALYGPDPTFVMDREKIIRGRVTDHEGHPRAGVTVTFSRTNRRELNFEPARATTDKDGQYEIRGARKRAGYGVEVDVDLMAGLLPCQGFADDTVGYEPIVIDLKCAKGVIVTGTVKNKGTGEPVVAQLWVGVIANNPFVEKYPPFMHAAAHTSGQFRSDARGNYRAVVIPGPVVLSAGPLNASHLQFKPAVPDPKRAGVFVTSEEGALMYDAYGAGGEQAFVQGSSWCKVLDAKPTDTELKVAVELEPSTKTAVPVVDADGRPVSGVKATGIEDRQYAVALDLPNAALTVYNLDVAKKRLVAVAQEKRKLVGTLQLNLGTKDPVVKLGVGGSVTGRAVDRDGKPLAGLEVHVDYERQDVSEVTAGLRKHKIVTNAKGEYRIDTLVPGQEFRIVFTRGEKPFGADFENAPKYTAAGHGDVLKLGDRKLEPAEDDGEE